MTTAPLRYYLDPQLRAEGIEFSSPREGDAGFDLRAASSLVIEPGEQALVPTGLKLALPKGWVGFVKDRSSMALRRIYSHGGVIDAGYRGEVKLILSNAGGEPYAIAKGAKVAQLVILPCLTIGVEATTEGELGETPRGEGGFGSTGTE